MSAKKRSATTRRNAQRAANARKTSTTSVPAAPSVGTAAPAPRAPRPDVWTRLTTWFVGTRHATIGFSLFRILFGASMLIVLLPSFADRHYLWGEGSWWVEPEARRRGWWEPLRLLFPKDSVFWFDVAYAALIALVVVFILGWMTRWVTPVLLVVWVGLSTNTTLLTNGGDTLMRIALLFAVFASLSEHFSVDAWLRTRRARRGVTRRRRPAWLPTWISTWTHNTALVLCCYQILLVYLVSSILKLSGTEWLDGTALYYALALDEFRVLPGLSDILGESALLVMVGTWMALTVQLLFPVALLWRPSRYVAVVLITFTHLGIAVLLGLWPFSLAMIALDLLLIRDSSWRRLGRFVRGRARALVAPRPVTSPSPGLVGSHAVNGGG
jgi:hypothetical protein